MSELLLKDKFDSEFAKPGHGNFIRLLEDSFAAKLSGEEELALARIARRRGWNLRYEHRFEAALTCFRLAVKVFEAGDYTVENYKLKKGIAFCESGLGNPSEAVTILKSMLRDLQKLIRSKKYPSGTSPVKSGKFYPEYEMLRTVFYMSIAYAKQGRLADAGKCLARASDLTGGNIRFRGLVLQGKGKLLHRRGLEEGAIAMFRRAAAVFRGAGNEYKAVNAAEDIAASLHYLGRYAEAIKVMNKVLGYYEEKKVEDHWAYFHRAASLEKLRRYKEAKKDYVKAVATFEKLRGDIRTDHFRRTFSSSRMVIYERAALNAVSAGEPENAYMLLQKAKARSFIEMMINRHSYGSAPVKLIRELEKARTELSESEGSDKVREIVRRRKRLAELIREVEQEAARNRENISLEPLDISSIRKKIPDGALILDFLVTELKTVIFAVSRDIFEIFEMDKGAKELSETAQIVNGFIVDAGTSAPEERELKEGLLKWYMGKVSAGLPAKLTKELIPGCKNLVIVPHGSLHSFPFCLLVMDGGRYLTEEKPLYYIDNIQRIGKKPLSPSGDMLIVSDPTEDLAFAGEEASRIRAIFGAGKCRVLKRSACLRKSVLRALDKYSMFHFAGHALIDESRQDMSRLLLSDGALRVSGLFGRRIKSRFVFLNGCQTARGKVMPGDEMNSFSRAFHFAGADEVIVNLWEVGDSCSPVMSKLFYEKFFKGMLPEKALQEAQKRAIADGLSPFVWAAFKVIK